MSNGKATSSLRVAWHISSYSANGSGQCVEAGRVRGESVWFAVRDSQHRALATLMAPAVEWAAFLDGVRTDEF